MAPVVRIDFGDDKARNDFRELAEAAAVSFDEPPLLRDGAHVPQVFVALGSAGVFSALFQIIGQIVRRNAEREVSVARNGVCVVVKGHSLPEELELLRRLAPELVEERECGE